MEVSTRTFSVMHYPLALLVVLTVGLLAWHQVGMDRVLVLDATSGHTFEAHDDRTEGGSSVATVRREGKSIVLDCELSKKYEWPYCEIGILLASPPKGLDLTGFDSVSFDLLYTGPGLHNVRFYMRNFEPGFSKVGDYRTLKVNEIEFPVDEKGTILIPMKFVRVASWWTVDMNVPLFHSDMRIDNVPAVELTTGSLAEEGHHRIELRSIQFHGKRISQHRLLILLVSAWLAYGVLWLGVGFLHFRGRLKESSERLARLRSINQALHLETRELAGQVRTDALTGTLNREGLRAFLVKQWNSQASAESAMTVIFADIDHFKQINDRHGHAVGDDVLREFARMVQDEIRATDRLVRWGGEEFLIVCPDTEARQGYALAEKLRQATQSHGWPHDLKMSCSFGVSVHIGKEDFGDTIKRADDALYKAKAGGRNRVEAA